MEIFLGKITQHAMNYAIRAGIGITASYTLRQTSRLLRTVDDHADYDELQSLQETLNTKLRILSPAIDLIEIISARGNTTLETAVSTTKSIRWDVQALGVRLAKAAAAEESSRKKSNKSYSKASHEAEIKAIVQDMRKLITKIDQEVPLINLAMATSGAKLSTTKPASVSTSRLLQASAFINDSNNAWDMSPGTPVQVGPTFTLSLYMLFAGHSARVHESAENMREAIWKEVIHKARIKLMRVPLYAENPQSEAQYQQSTAHDEGLITREGSQNEYAYHVEIIEDLDDDRVHAFEDDEAQPGPYGGVQLAGIRDFLPIHQISKIFYADTGKILNIGNDGEPNNPVLLLKRDTQALLPCKMMQESDKEVELYDEDEGIEDPEDAEVLVPQDHDDNEDDDFDINEQIRRESSVAIEPESEPEPEPITDDQKWRLPIDLDPEWLAFEVYTETEPEESDSDTEPDTSNDSAYVSHRPSSAADNALASELAHLDLDDRPSPSPSPALRRTTISQSDPAHHTHDSRYGPIQSRLSLLEMLIRLTALQQFKQASHLIIKDEFLNFFLEESSTTGAGGDGEERRRTRREARQKVGFDPYDESPVKRHGEDYQYQYQYQNDHQQYQQYQPYDGFDQSQHSTQSPRWSREGSVMSPGQRQNMTPEPWLLSRRDNEFAPGSRSSSRRATPGSPISPYRPQQRPGTRPLDRVQAEKGLGKGSPLGRSQTVETDSTLGTSPASPSLRKAQGKN